MQRDSSSDVDGVIPLSFTGKVLAERYQIGEKIGEGSSGIVFDGRDTIIGLPVAIKVISRTGGKRGFQISREMQLAFSIRHENLVALLDCLVDETKAYLIYERVDAGTLREFLRNRASIDLGQSLRMLGQLLKGVAALHRVGVVHCDIKPENVLLNSNGVIQIADFGVASLLSDPDLPVSPNSSTDVCSSVTFVTGVAGTPMYIAPESVASGIVNMKSDIHALGIIAYELFTGHFPFDATQTVQGLLDEKAVKKPEAPHALNPHCPVELSTLCLRMLHPDPSIRPNSVSDIEVELQALQKSKYAAGNDHFVDQARLDRVVSKRRSRRSSDTVEDSESHPTTFASWLLNCIIKPAAEILLYPLRMISMPVGKIWADSPFLLIFFIMALVGGLGYLVVQSQDDPKGSGPSAADLYPGYKSLEGGAKSFIPAAGKSKVIRSIDDLKSTKRSSQPKVKKSSETKRSQRKGSPDTSRRDR